MDELGTLKGKLFADAQGYLVSVEEEAGDTIRFAPQGGGFLMRAMPRSTFLATFNPATLPPYKAAKFGADWLPEDFVLEGYTNGYRWNGWAMPYFTKEAGLKLMQEMPGLKFDEALNAFTARDEGIVDEESDMTFPSKTLDVDGAQVPVYAIGAGSWCWDLAD